MELFEALGLDIRILIAQLINFAILVFVLYRFAYRPIFDVLDKRKKKIEEGMQNAQNAEKKLKEAHGMSREIVREAKREAKNIVEKALEKGQARREELLRETKHEMDGMLAHAKKEIEGQKSRVIEDLQGDIARLIVHSLERILGEYVTQQKQDELVKKALEELPVYKKEV